MLVHYTKISIFIIENKIYYNEINKPMHNS